jgi:hypothetical protein
VQGTGSCVAAARSARDGMPRLCCSCAGSPSGTSQRQCEVQITRDQVLSALINTHLLTRALPTCFRSSFAASCVRGQNHQGYMSRSDRQKRKFSHRAGGLQVMYSELQHCNRLVDDHALLHMCTFLPHSACHQQHVTTLTCSKKNHHATHWHLQLA